MTTVSLAAHHLNVHVTALDRIELQEQMGASLRGAFFEALWGRFCMNKEATTCADCPLMKGCPVSSLVAPLRDERPRIRDVPRPFAIRPPINHPTSLLRGDSFTFGLTIFGSRLELFPYVVMALQAMGHMGIGQRVKDHGWQRGRFEIGEVQVANVLSGEAKTVVSAESTKITFPDLPTTWADAERSASTMRGDRVALRLLTPLRLKANRQFMERPLLQPLVERLLERHDFLAMEYDGTPFEKEERLQLIALAAQIEIAHSETRWTNLRSYSCRQQKGMSIGGIMGTVIYRGELSPLLPLLVWGTVIQAGKATTKGNGVYEIGESAHIPESTARHRG